jgi:hypothetical protein
MVRAPKGFVDETLWPEFEEFNRTLHTYLEEATKRAIRQEIHQNGSEAGTIYELTGRETGTIPAQDINIWEIANRRRASTSQSLVSLRLPVLLHDLIERQS